MREESKGDNLQNGEPMNEAIPEEVKWDLPKLEDEKLQRLLEIIAQLTKDKDMREGLTCKETMPGSLFYPELFIWYF